MESKIDTRDIGFLEALSANQHIKTWTRGKKEKGCARRSGHWAREAGVAPCPPPPRGQQAGIPSEWQFRGMLRPIRPRGFPTPDGSGGRGRTGTVRPGLPLERRRMVSPRAGSGRRGSKRPVSAGPTRRKNPVPEGRIRSHLASTGLGAGPDFSPPTLGSEPPLRGPGLSANALTGQPTFEVRGPPRRGVGLPLRGRTSRNHPGYPRVLPGPPWRGPRRGRKKTKKAQKHASKARISMRNCVVGAIFQGASFYAT